MNEFERDLAKRLLDENILSSADKRKLVNELFTSLDQNYKQKIINITKSKYTMNGDEKEEVAKDLYSEACVIFINKVHTDPEFLRDIKYEGFMLGVCRNLHLERTRKNKEIVVDDISLYDKVEELLNQNPYESEEIQKMVEDALIDYYEANQLIDCLIIMQKGWKEGLKNQALAELLDINEEATTASRRVTVNQQNCMKLAWRNVKLLQLVRERFNMKKRNKINWKK